MYFKQQVNRIIKKIYESDTEDPLTDCQVALEKQFNNEQQKVIFIQEYLEEISPSVIGQHINWLTEQEPEDLYILSLPEYNVFNIVALVKRNKGA